MYTTINDNIGNILSFINKETYIDPYVELIKEPMTEGVEIFHSDEYRKKYKRYWAMDVARLPEEFINEYFKILSESYNKNSQPSDIAEQLSKLSNNYQFSFATKLVHMSNTSLPIYDSRISAFFHMPSITNKKSIQMKKELSESIYQFLLSEYDQILSFGKLKHSIKAFRDHFGVDEIFSNHKIIDSLIWAVISSANKGAVINKNILYI